MKRTYFLQQILQIFDLHPVCALLGPRQVGKTTLARQFAEEYFPGNAIFFDLENPLDLKRLENPLLTLSEVEQELIVIDEIQVKPDLFPLLRVLADRTRGLTDGPPYKKSFLILGSTSRHILHNASESLAGRVGHIELYPFSLFEEVEPKNLWLRGGFPNAYLAPTDAMSCRWRKHYFKTFLEIDLPALGYSLPNETLRRFWNMLAHYHGQIFNAQELARSLDVSQPTIGRYLDALTSTFMMRKLNPWHASLKKRQVKSFKTYFRDTGLLLQLLGIETYDHLMVQPRLGALFEGFALEEIIRLFQADANECFFWATHASAELDLLILKDSKKLGFEFKYSEAPSTTKSMHIALKDLELDHLAVIYPGTAIFPLAENITAYGLYAIQHGTFQNKFSEITQLPFL